VLEYLDAHPSGEEVWLRMCSTFESNLGLETSMKSLGTIIQWIVSLAVVGGGIFGFFAMGEPEVFKRPPIREGALAVQTIRAASHQENLCIEVDGVVIPFRQVEIAAEVRGRVSKKSPNCRKGREVKRGELLIEIDSRDYELDVQRLEEELEQADAMIRELEVEIQNAENQKELTTQQLEIDTRQLERNMLLSSTNAASQTELDTARRTELATRNAFREIRDSQQLLRQRLIRMESGKDLVRANYEKAQLALDRTKIHSPLDGVIVEESVEQDGYVQSGNPVIVIQDNSQFDVTCKLHMRQMHWLWQSQSSTTATDPANQDSVQADMVSDQVRAADRDEADEDSTQMVSAGYDFPEVTALVNFDLGGTTYQWSGMVDRYDGAGIDAQTRMVPCRVHIDQPLNVTALFGSDSDLGESDTASRPPALMTGMFVKVQMFVPPPMPLIRVPQNAIQPGDVVWTVREGALVSCPVRRATVEGDFVIAYEEADGLMVGDSIVVSPLATPFDGQKVKEVGQ